VCVDIRLILAIVACEALVELIKKAAPLQGLKRWIISKTPFLYSREQETHLLECPWCVSVWVGFSVMALYIYMDSTVFLLFVGGLALHRLSNFLHLIFSFLRDKQFDLRVQRGK